MRMFAVVLLDFVITTALVALIMLSLLFAYKNAFGPSIHGGVLAVLFYLSIVLSMWLTDRVLESMRITAWRRND